MKRTEENDKNQDKKAIAADSSNLLHIGTGQYDGPAPWSMLVTLAVEQAAASERNDKACNQIKGNPFLSSYERTKKS